MNSVHYALICGTIARIPALYIQARRSDIKIWKIIPFTILLTVAELSGTMILYWIENGFFGGMSYYGGILLMPLFSVLLALLFKIKYLDLMDLCGVSAGGMLAVMRTQCAYSGCCNGIMINLPGEVRFAFPSPIVELITVLIIMLVVLKMGKNQEYSGKLFPIYLIFYGVTRFVLNFFREGTEPFVWILPPGHFWSIVAVFIGVFWIVFLDYRKKRRS